MSDGLFLALFDRPAIYRAIEIMAPDPIERAAVAMLREPMRLGSFYPERPTVGPRGGEGNRAKTKATRKANLRRRKSA